MNYVEVVVIETLSCLGSGSIINTKKDMIVVNSKREFVATS